MRYLVVLALLSTVAGCPASAPPCDANKTVFADADGDGWGGGPPLLVCEIGDHQADRALDCDDNDATVNPDAKEICDNLDNNCDGQIDEGLKDSKQWWSDNDGDGFGGLYESKMFCGDPGKGWARNSDDCDDSDPFRNPNAQEICGTGDEDCDGLVDDDDPSVDPSTFHTFYTDADHDGLGNHHLAVRACALSNGTSTNDNDCDDTNALVGQYTYYRDTDGDGYGDASNTVQACSPPAGTVTNSLDCDDTDPSLNLVHNWYTDSDGDGFGGYTLLGVGCVPPQGGVASATDCDDSDPAIHPGAHELCENGIDEGCDGDDRCDTCEKLLEQTPGLTSGTYTLELSTPREVYCDMTTDGGGWTLVFSSNIPPEDVAQTYYTYALQSLDPGYVYASGVWSGMRSAMSANSDIRFACRKNGNSAFKVDLSFYDTPWYQQITASTSDAAVCFETGTNHSDPPARTNNLTGDTLPAGSTWNTPSGYLQGEDTCSSYDDFAVDFNDGGMLGSNPGDGTDWGTGNYSYRCGTNGVSANTFDWYMFVREE